MSSLYDMSVPVYVRALENMKHVLSVGENWANENKVELSKLIDARLAPDMRPLTYQVQAASNTSKAVLSRIADQDEPSMEDNEQTFAELHARIDKTLDALHTAKRANFDGKESKEVSLRDGKYKFTALEYLQIYEIPNFFFHVTATYAILRNQGVPVGKLDFLLGGRSI